MGSAIRAALILKLALHGDEWTLSHFGRFTHGARGSCSRWTGGCVSPRDVSDNLENRHITMWFVFQFVRLGSCNTKAGGIDNNWCALRCVVMCKYCSRVDGQFRNSLISIFCVAELSFSPFLCYILVFIFNLFVTNGIYVSHLQRFFSSPLG